MKPKIGSEVEKKGDYHNCPFCQSERDGMSKGWGMSDEGWEELREIHERLHK